jgi:hypothetical protein
LQQGEVLPRQIRSGEVRIGNGRILCVPAHDQADEIASAMLAQLLEQQGDIALSFLVGTNFSDALALVDPGPQDMICISALPPFAFTPARKMYKQLRARFPKVNITVGIWGFSGDREKAKASFERTQPDQLFTSFLQVMEHTRPPTPASAEPAVREQDAAVTA